MRISFATFSKLKGSETVVTSTGFIPSSSRRTIYFSVLPV